jgi:hypothetical protein|nr:MAG TPA: hypothetical protein [Caudoviricetes sp.]
MLTKRQCQSSGEKQWKKEWFGVEVCQLRLGTYLDYVYYRNNYEIVQYEAFYTKHLIEISRKIQGPVGTKEDWKVIVPMDMISDPAHPTDDENMMVELMLGLDDLEIAIYHMCVEAAAADFDEKLDEQELQNLLTEKLKEYFTED